MKKLVIVLVLSLLFNYSFGQDILNLKNDQLQISIKKAGAGLCAIIK